MSQSVLKILASKDLQTKPLIISNTEHHSAQDLDERSQKLASQCLLLATSKETPLGILASPSINFVSALLGVWKAQLIATPLQPLHPLDELSHIVTDTGMEFLLAEKNLQKLAHALAERHSLKIIWIEDCSTKELSKPIEPLSDLAKPALIIYTSGTTNKPKGVVLSFNNLDASIQSLCETWEWQNSDRTLNCLPLHHIHGLVNILLCSLASGACCEFLDKFSPEVVWNQIESGEINVFMAVPTIYTKLIQYWSSQPEARQATLRSAAHKMRLMVSGSAALPEQVFKDWQNIASTPLLERYGMTEIGMALANPMHSLRKPGTVGFPIGQAEVRIVNEQNQEINTPLAPGEIQVRGPTVFSKYWNRPLETSHAFTDDGWFKTGDVAETDEDGYFKILGRLSQDIIKSGAYKISALEIESKLLCLPEVSEAAVVAIKDDLWGEKICAAIILKPNTSLTEMQIREKLKTTMASYKIPQSFLFKSSLPRNAMGKLIKGEIRQWFSS